MSIGCALAAHYFIIAAMDFVKFGEAVKRRRMEDGMSQEELADRVGISRTYISLLERGQATNLSWSVVSKLNTILGIKVASPGEEVSAEGLTDEERQRMPISLKDFIANSKVPIALDDQRMLLNLVYRGQQPTTEDEWRILFNMIKHIITKE